MRSNTCFGMVRVKAWSPADRARLAGRECVAARERQRGEAAVGVTGRGHAALIDGGADRGQRSVIGEHGVEHESHVGHTIGLVRVVVDVRAEQPVDEGVADVFGRDHDEAARRDRLAEQAYTNRVADRPCDHSTSGCGPGAIGPSCSAAAVKPISGQQLVEGQFAGTSRRRGIPDVDRHGATVARRVDEHRAGSADATA